MNVLKDWAHSRRYYLTHPWKWFKEIGQNLRSAWERATKGYCYSDVWNIDLWLLNILPAMFRDMAASGCGYPGPGTEFDTPEKWRDHLLAMADVLESLQFENYWEDANEYKDEYLHSPTRNEVKELFFAREQELYEQRQQLLQDTFLTLAYNLDKYWD